jgi:hypothetical protein
VSFEQGGWTATASVGAALATAAFLLFLSERGAAAA